MRTMPTRLAVVAIAGAFGVAACSTDQPPMCESLAAVQHTADRIRNANVSENGVTQLRTDVQQLRSELQQLYSDAQAQFATELDAVRAAANQFSASVAAARAAPDATTLAAVRTSMTAVQQGVQTLAGAMSGTC